jgi:hypothetical protein
MRITTKVNMPIIKGQILYHVFGDFKKKMVEVEVTEIVHNAFGIYVHAIDKDENGYRFAIIYTSGRNDFGKRVYFTREAAEAALNGGGAE